MELATSTSRTACREPTRNIEQLARAVLGRERLTIVTGNAGTGKTTLCLALAERFGARTWGSLVLEPPADTAALLDTILVDLGGIAPARVSEPEECQLAALLDYLRHASGAAAVVVDSAHDVPVDMFATLVRVARDAARLGITLQLVLVGLPSLDERLSHPDVLDAVRDLGARREHLEPLAEADIKSFMERRWWRACGGIGAPADAVAPPGLNRAAAHLAFCVSAGNPRTVAAIADRLRWDARVIKNGRVGAATMQRVVAELGLPVSARPWSLAWATVGAAVLALAGILAGAGSHTSGPGAEVPQRRDAAPGATITPRSISLPSPPPSAGLPVAEEVGTFRRRTLDAAARMARAPDVRGILRLEDEAKQWDVATQYANHATVSELLVTLEQLTNDARARQLADDGRQLRESRSPQTP